MSPPRFLVSAALLLAAPAPGWAAGDAARGAVIAQSRQSGLCALCHRLPGGEPVLQGTIGPDLRGVGARLSVDDLRRRLIDPPPQSLMPAYGLQAGAPPRVAAAFRGRPILTEPEIDDVIAWLQTLKD